MYFNFEMGFKLQEHLINSQDPAETQFNSSCLEIDDSGDTSTGSETLVPVKVIQWYHQN